MRQHKSSCKLPGPQTRGTSPGTWSVVIHQLVVVSLQCGHALSYDMADNIMACVHLKGMKASLPTASGQNHLVDEKLRLWEGVPAL